MEGEQALNPDLRAELLAMQDADQHRRCRAMDASDDAATVAWDAVREADHRHTARLREIVAEHGWPGRSLVGDDGSHAAWLLAQHADDEPQFQRRCLELLAAAVASGDAAAVDWAYLADRVAVKQGLPQLHGTQFRQDGDRFVPSPMDDVARVEQRRAALGLPTLAQYAEMVNQPRPNP